LHQTSINAPPEKPGRKEIELWIRKYTIAIFAAAARVWK
jgi:hypothetical protein